MHPAVIIPTLNEGINLPRLLADFQPEETAHAIIVVDGGSRDDTVRMARHGWYSGQNAAPRRAHPPTGGTPAKHRRPSVATAMPRGHTAMSS